MISAILRALRVLFHLIRGMSRALVMSLQEAAGMAVRRDIAMQDWTRRLLEILRVNVHHVGTPSEGGATLIAANHISWLDIPVLGAACPSHFLAKAEVGQWPAIGWLARQAGTLFIRRGGGHLASARRAIRQKLAAGRSVVFFPEGTTTRGDKVGRFYPRLFQAAMEASRPVQPVAIHYRRRGEPDTLAPFVGDDTFVPHLWRLLKAPPTDVYVHWGPLLEPADNPAALARQSHRFCATTVARLNWIPHEGHLDLWVEGLA